MHCPSSAPVFNSVRLPLLRRVGPRGGLFATAVSGLVAWHAGRFVWTEYSFESTAFSGIPAWTLQSILPFAFGMIALRYLVLLVRGVLDERPEPQQ